MTKKNRFRANLGFTLTELLAVVIIVGILSSLGFGFYKKSVEQARFGEGLSIASAVVESVNREHEDYALEDATHETFKFSSLDMGGLRSSFQACETESDYCRASKYFEITTNGDATAAGNAGGVVIAYRGTVANHRYALRLTSSFVSPKDQVACWAVPGGSYASFDAKTFCESMGYMRCVSNICTQ